MKTQNVTYKTRESQSSIEQFFIPKADGILLDPLNKFTKTNIINNEKLINCFFH